MHDIKFLVRQVRSLPGPLLVGRDALKRARELTNTGIPLTKAEESDFLEAWSDNSEPLLTKERRTIDALVDASLILGNMAKACADGAQSVRDFGCSEEHARDAEEIQSRTRGLSDFVNGDEPYREWVASLALPNPSGPIPQGKGPRAGNRVDLDGPGLGCTKPGSTIRGNLVARLQVGDVRLLHVEYIDKGNGAKVTMLLVNVGDLCPVSGEGDWYHEFGSSEEGKNLIMVTGV